MREREEREGERKNYVSENVIKCTHTSKHFCMNSLVNNCGQISSYCMENCNLFNRASVPAMLVLV